MITKYFNNKLENKKEDKIKVYLNRNGLDNLFIQNHVFFVTDYKKMIMFQIMIRFRENVVKYKIKSINYLN